MYFLIDLSEKYNTTWDKVSAAIRKQFDDQHVHNKEYLKTKIKCPGNEVTDFGDRNIPVVDSIYKCFQRSVNTLEKANNAHQW